MSSEDRLEAIKRRHEQATHGPWEWTHSEVNERYPKRSSQRFVYLLQGPDPYRDLAAWTDADPPVSRPVREDWPRDPYERQVMQLRWDQVRGTTIVNAGPVGPNADFVEHSWDDVRWLIAEVERLRKEAAE